MLLLQVYHSSAESAHTLSTSLHKTSTRSPARRTVGHDKALRAQQDSANSPTLSKRVSSSVGHILAQCKTPTLRPSQRRFWGPRKRASVRGPAFPARARERSSYTPGIAILNQHRAQNDTTARLARAY